MDLKKVIIIGVIFSTVSLISTIYLNTTLISLQNENLEDKKTKLDESSLKLLEACEESKRLGYKDLILSCIDSLKEIKESCNDPSSLNHDLTICNNPLLDQFFINADDKITEDQKDLEIGLQKVNDKSLEIVNLCYESDVPSCKESMLNIKERCNKPSFSSLTVCDDPRVDEILNRKQSSTNSVEVDKPIETQKSNMKCLQDRLCVKPGDFLKYKADPTVSYVGHDFDGNLTYAFVDFIDTNRIKVNLTFDANDGKHYFQERIMNVLTGLLETPEQIVDPTVSGEDLPHFLYSISPTMLTYDKLDDVTIEEKVFGAWHGKGDRYTIILRNTNPDVTVAIDKETHVIISSFEARYGGGDNSNYVLIDTNVFGMK